MDIRRGGLGQSPSTSFFDLPNARLIRKTNHARRNSTLYIVAVCKADQAVEIIRSQAAETDDEVAPDPPLTGENTIVPAPLQGAVIVFGTAVVV